MNHPLADRFRSFEGECRGSSALYHALAHAVAEDDDLLTLAAEARPAQPIPNLFFASVHFLLLSGRAHPVAAFYASLTPSPGFPNEAFASFKDFAMTHRQEIALLLKTRLVQTNEVRRCAYLFPSFLHVAGLFDDRPLALIELGTSAGLNLLWDRYAYAYGSARYGAPSSPLRITSSFRGPIRPALAGNAPPVSHRIGLDLFIIDARVPEEALWLRALIWPEHADRRRMLEAALKVRKRHALDLREGDGISRLAGVVAEIPEDSLACIYHTHVANQLSEKERLGLLSAVAAIGRARDVVHIHNNINPTLHLSAYRRGKLIDYPLARTDGHARWIEWLQEAVRIA